MARVTIYTAACIAEAERGSVKGRTEVAIAAAEVARSTAPVESGEFRSGMGTQVSGTDVLIVSNDPESGYKEYGTSDTPAHMTLTNAARRFGRYYGR